MHYLITGSTGFIGQHIIEHLIAHDHEITILSRNPSRVLHPCRGIADLNELPSDSVIDVVINLAGSPIDRYWRKAVKEELLTSRVSVTRALVELLSRLKQKPALMISASAIGFYGPQGDIQLSEHSHGIDCFTHRLCQAWETEAKRVQTLGVRLCITRFGVVLGQDGGMLKKLYLPFFLGLGGQLGAGDQILSWIHIDDLIRGFDYLIHNKKANGIYNFTAPQPVSNAVFARTLGNALHRPTFMRTSAWLIRKCFGEMGNELLLKGQYVLPVKLLSEQFVFQYSVIEDALLALLR